MVLGSSPLQGDRTPMASPQGSKLSQMKDSFQKRMQRDKEKARVPATAARLPATQRTANGGVAAPRSAPATPAAPPTPKARDEERRPQPPAPGSSVAAPPPRHSKESSPRKSPAAASAKTYPANSTPSRPRPSATKQPSTPAQSRAPAAMKKAAAPPPSSGLASNLPQCRNCGRHFAADRLPLHESICLKTSKKKRKVFDPTKMRVKGTEAEAYLRNPAARVNKVPPMPKPDWRRKHEDFIRSIRDAKAAQAYVAAGGKLSDLPPPPPMDTSDLIPCPHCGRKFNEAAAERHIPRCKDIINKPKPPPGARAGGGTSGAIPKGPKRR